MPQSANRFFHRSSRSIKSLSIRLKYRLTSRLTPCLGAATLSLKQDYGHSCKVVDITEALKLIQIFKTGAFDALPVSTQGEILKERIRRIVVQEKGLYVEFFGQKLEYVSGILNGNGEKNDLNATRSTPSGVLPVFKMVPPSKRTSN